MAILQPAGSDPLNIPDHALMHRVFATDGAAPVRSVTVDSAGSTTFRDGNVTMPTGSGQIAFKRLLNRVNVGPLGEFSTLKAAVDWFNASATENTEIFVDAGIFPVTDTIVVNNSSYGVTIRGLGTGATFLNAATGLAGKPMFELRTQCDLNRMYCNGSTLASYGTGTANENGISFTTNPDVQYQLIEMIFNTFTIGVADLIGVNVINFNDVIQNCPTGIAVNYTTNSPTTSTMMDLEASNVINCPIGVNLIKTGAAKKNSFFISQVLVSHTNTTDIFLKYDGVNYIYNGIANLTGCTLNNIGSMTSGFDFTNTRDANINIQGNVGEEDKKPHAKIGVTGDTNAVTITTGGQYYKAAFVNGTVYNCKFTIANNRMTFQSDYSRDIQVFVSAGQILNRNNAQSYICIRKEIPVTSVVGNGVIATVTTTNNHNIVSGTRIQMLGWSSATFNGLKTITVTGPKTFTYPNAVATTPVGGNCGAMFGEMQVRSAGTTVLPLPVSTNCYLDNFSKNEYIELYVMTATGGDTIIISDVSWMVNSI